MAILTIMIPQALLQGLAMVLLGSGSLGAAEVALHFEQPFLGLGYMIAALVLVMAGISRLVRAF